MSSRSATRRASPASMAEQHPFLLSRRESGSSVCAPVRMNRPTTSYPCSLSSTADAELSTPPDIAKTTRRRMQSLSLRDFTSIEVAVRELFRGKRVRIARLRGGHDFVGDVGDLSQFALTRLPIRHGPQRRSPKSRRENGGDLGDVGDLTPTLDTN